MVGLHSQIMELGYKTLASVIYLCLSSLGEKSAMLW